MAYYDNVNPQIYTLVSENAKRICELGCGAGALAAALAEKCPNLEFYLGLELDASQANLAKKHTTVTLQRNLDSIENWDVDLELASHAPKDSFDHILIGDVLEHLYDPLKTLKEAVSRLRVGGTVIACIPNVQNWTVFYNLIKGTWPREDQGLFDSTHIRWFTLDDMVQLFQNAGLNITHIEPREFPSEQGISVMEDLEPLARNIGMDPDVLIARGQVLQFVLVGERIS
jgi:SAM-dependent methyltransferase